MQPPKDQGFQDPNRDGKEKRYPFDKGKKHMKETVVDPKSDLVYEDKHWKPVDEMKPATADEYKIGNAPITEMQESGICDGVLHLTGTFALKHKDEIMNAIKNSKELAEERDAMNQVANIEENENGITVYTVKNRLAVTLGKKIDSAFKGGKLEITWSDDDKPADVKWHKDLE